MLVMAPNCYVKRLCRTIDEDNLTQDLGKLAKIFCSDTLRKLHQSTCLLGAETLENYPAGSVIEPDPLCLPRMTCRLLCNANELASEHSGWQVISILLSHAPPQDTIPPNQVNIGMVDRLHQRIIREHITFENNRTLSFALMVLIAFRARLKMRPVLIFPETLRTSIQDAIDDERLNDTDRMLLQSDFETYCKYQ